MKVIIAGSRDFEDMEEVKKAIAASKFKITEVVSGGARGVDSMGEDWAWDNQVEVKLFLAEWDKYGKRAGPIRNAKMANYADALIALPGAGPGTKDMIARMRQLGKPIYVRDEK